MNVSTKTDTTATSKIPLWGEPPEYLEIPGIDMYINRGQLITEVSLPEFRSRDIDVSANSEGMEISAVRKMEQDLGDDKQYLMREGRQSYWRRLSLPKEAVPEETVYSFRGGKLRIMMPVNLSNDFHKKKGGDYVSAKNTPYTEDTEPIVLRNTDFPDHWTRYRPVRRASRLR